MYSPLWSSYAPVKHAAFHHYLSVTLMLSQVYFYSLSPCESLRDCVKEFLEGFLHSFTSKFIPSWAHIPQFLPVASILASVLWCFRSSSIFPLHCYLLILLGVKNEGDYIRVICYYFQYPRKAVRSYSGQLKRSSTPYSEQHCMAYLSNV